MDHKFPIAGEFFPLLEAFAQPQVAQDGIAEFLRRYTSDVERDAVNSEVHNFVERLKREHILIEVGSRARPLVGGYYAHPGLHVTLLSDFGRTIAYREALAKHAPGQVVLEIGCGSGVLACFAARANAKHVYAVERSAILEIAMEVAERNGLSDQITFIAADSREIELPQKAGVIVSEIVGSDPLVQELTSTLSDASRRHLAPNGRMIPQTLRVVAVGIDSERFRSREYVREHQVRSAEQLGAFYGLDLSPLSDAYRTALAAEDRQAGTQESIGGPFLGLGAEFSDVVVSEEVEVTRLDLSALTEPGVQQVSLSAAIRRSGVCNAVALYFTASLDEELFMSTSPFGPQPTVAWGQMVQPITPQRVDVGDCLRLTAQIDPNARPTITFTRT